jgi:hypothetical protein
MKKLILEGKYDTFTKKIVNDLMSLVKETEGDLDMVHDFDLTQENEYYHDYSGISIDVGLRVHRVDSEIQYNNKEIPYYIDTYISDDDYLIIDLTINESYGRKYYQEIYYKLNEDVRHEIEHYVQDKGITQKRFKTRKQPIIPNTAEYKSTYAHHKDPSEVEALVHGFYRRAKLEKKPLDIVMIRDLETDIERGNLTKKEAEDLFSIWLKYSRRNLPHAKYSS